MTLITDMYEVTPYCQPDTRLIKFKLNKQLQCAVNEKSMYPDQYRQFLSMDDNQDNNKRKESENNFLIER